MNASSILLPLKAHSLRWLKRVDQTLLSGRMLQGTVALLTVLVVLSAMAVIYSKHMCRQLFSQIQSLDEEQEAYGREWTQLLLEQGTWGATARVEKKAKENLGMHAAPASSIVVIKEKS